MGRFLTWTVRLPHADWADWGDDLLTWTGRTYCALGGLVKVGFLRRTGKRRKALGLSRRKWRRRIGDTVPYGFSRP